MNLAAHIGNPGGSRPHGFPVFSAGLTYSFNTPVGKPAEAQCGRVVYSSFHIASKAFGTTYPGECTPGPLTQQEKVLEFMLFDLASCVQTDTEVPKPPPVK